MSLRSLFSSTKKFFNDSLDDPAKEISVEIWAEGDQYVHMRLLVITGETIEVWMTPEKAREKARVLDTIADAIDNGLIWEEMNRDDDE